MVLERLKMFGGETQSEARASGDPEGPQTFVELLEAMASTWGDKVAFQQKVRRDWQKVTFNQVRSQSRAVAAALIAHGLKPGERVAIVGENGIEWACAYYGIVLAGGVGVPVYYDLQPSEVEDAVGRSGAQIAFVSGKALKKFHVSLPAVRTIVVFGEGAAAGTDVSASLQRGTPVSFDAFVAGATPESRETLAQLEVSPDDLASIVFTSGTSGGMKGVMLTHRNFMANLQQVRRSIPLSETDRIAMVLPMHHAFPFTMTMVVGPYIGGTVTFENDLRRIRDRMAEIKPTIFIGVPQLFDVMWRNIVHSIEVQGRLETFEKGLRIVEATKKRTGVNLGRIVFRELHARLGGSLRFAVSGGAALNPQMAANFAKIGLPIIQGWGLTEAAPVLAAQRWNPRKFYMTNHYEERFGTVGPAVEGVEVALIDVPEKELYVHLHGEGEIIARGDNISPGYWQADDATEASRLGEWFRTGDVGRIDDEGNIWITGRSKFVIVLDSGEKIHPDEVEEKLERSTAIEDVAVIGRKVRGKPQAWAVIYPNRDVIVERLRTDNPSEDDVRRIVKAEIDEQEAEIAPYKRTVDFMLTDTPLPKTPGLRKVMRGKLIEEYSFEPARWAQTWPEHLEAIATPGSSSEEVPSEEAATVSV